MSGSTLAPIRTCNACGQATTDYTERDVLGVTHIVCAACESTPGAAENPVTSAVKNLRVCRGYMMACTAALDQPETREAHHALLLSLAELDDCLTALEPDEQPTTVIEVGNTDWLGRDLGRVSAEARSRVHRGDTIADDRRDDLMMDGDHSDPDRGEV